MTTKNPPSLISKIAEKFSVDPSKLFETLKATAFKQRNGDAPTNEQMMALLIVADQYGLNPFTREIYAFPDKNNGIIPVVGIDGWSRIINTNEQFDGMEFRFSENTITLKGLDKPVFEWIECLMYRKDRQRPTIIREYMDEIYRAPIEKNGSSGPYVITGPWQTHTRRFARHKVIIQTARIALGYTGIYDEDEADRIINGDVPINKVEQSIEFNTDAELHSLPTPSEKNELLQDLADANFAENGVEEAEFVALKNDGDDSSHHRPQANEFVDTPFGQISRKDVEMIGQLVSFAKDNGTWDTTKDSLQERYSGQTLEYAQKQLNEAFDAEFTPED